MRVLRQDYRAVNARGVSLYTFGDLDTAKAWARENAHLHDGLKIEEVTMTTRPVYTPRVTRRRPDFTMPRWAAVPQVQV